MFKFIQPGFPQRRFFLAENYRVNFFGYEIRFQIHAANVINASAMRGDLGLNCNFTPQHA